MRAELIAEIFRYVSGEAGIHDLQDWLMAHLQSIIDSGDQVAIEVANELDVDLIHLSDHVVSEQILWEHLVEAVRKYEPLRLQPGQTTSWASESFKPQITADVRLSTLEPWASLAQSSAQGTRP